MAKYKKKKQPHEMASVAEVAKKQTQPSSQPQTGKNTPQLMTQQRANFALQAVQDAIANPSIESKEFKSQVRRLPGMLQVNGFGQAIAFYYAKGKSGKLPACGEVYALLERWLCEKSPHSPYRGVGAAEPRLLTAITSADQQAYRQAQAETQALLQWVKRFCEGLIVKEDSEPREET
ncbi:type III-B CRISPR module-associated protein Cmr5 [Halomonas sp. GFAJ-1]|uniref:type III-B CRISPR module-associated protein Cmr5 n=1 Tax=Halomonas sp. GFAJ-1 TaxID=1118153 RepID=UPI00023A33C3|nr:type III-B CRISPR module-associated protein Cmr5 [Halomonas sp. GFAJ-1]AVI62973.1 type III-B CRISPR module-associated protein Cmr5 [Halomonas sp. GFAJ-1]EHK60279.1 CRISPR-associated protein, Cmr5 family [Halomonas sp. GFAJ-1]